MSSRVGCGPRDFQHESFKWPQPEVRRVAGLILRTIRLHQPSLFWKMRNDLQAGPFRYGESQFAQIESCLPGFKVHVVEKEKPPVLSYVGITINFILPRIPQNIPAPKE